MSATTQAPLVDRASLFPMNGTRNQNPPGLGLLALLREDLHTHQSCFSQGFWAVAVNRFGNWRMDLPGWIRPLASVLYNVLYRIAHWTCRIELPYIVKIGRRVRIWHHGGCVLGACSIGDDVQIRHNVTFGLAGHGDPIWKLPVLEERVIVGAGAAVLGPITIGHDSVIGANAVVTIDVPPHSLVAGIPGKVIRQLEEKERETWVRTKV
jgi:serine O-acetyltransferase